MSFSLMRPPRIKLVFLNVLVIFFTLNCLTKNGLSAPNGMHDVCEHSFKKSSGFFSRHFDGSFLKKFFKHWIPFTSTLRVKMQFYLYKKDFADCGREIILDDEESLKSSGFQSQHPTRIIIHGWMSQSKGTLNRAVKNAYLSLTQKNDATTESIKETERPETTINPLKSNNQKNGEESILNINMKENNASREVEIEDEDKDEDEDLYEMRRLQSNITDFNVIVVDWSVISSNVNYFEVVDMIEDLGFLLAEFVRFLNMTAGLNYDDVYLIGHSLGAQIAGSAGKQVKPFMFNTIFALDPAGPKFRNQSDEYRIDPTDARYVESIQTSIGLGFEDPVGHATFYPNFGRDQKKCFMYGCSHSRAHRYFAESITSSKGFWGVRCERRSEESWILSESGKQYRMGGEPSTPKTGTFYVKTNDKPPYAKGKKIEIVKTY